MNSQEERSVLHIIKIQAVKTGSEIECSDKTSFIGKQGALNKVDGLRVFCSVISANNTEC